MSLKVNENVPHFLGYDEEGKEHTSDMYRGKWLLLYFYPKDDTPGCTKQACNFRDIWKELSSENIVILGVSAQDETSHKKFKNKYSLPFPLIVDSNKELAQTFGAWGKKKFMGREFMGMQRFSFLIDPNQKLVKIYKKVKPGVHAQEVLEDVQSYKREKKM